MFACLLHTEASRNKCDIVLDGYGNGPSPKAHERKRRAKKVAAEVQVSESKPVFSSQKPFLSTPANSRQFITPLGNHQSATGHLVQYAA